MAQLLENPQPVEIRQMYITCPNCPFYGGNLHQIEVETGWRRSEDGEVVRTVSSDKEVKTDIIPDPEVIYGYRRDYLVIRFWCETCGRGGISLSIYQRKGSTIIEWVSLGEEMPDPEEE